MIRVNEGKLDRFLRVTLGVFLLLLFQQGFFFGIIGFIPLLTGIFGVCPLYSLFGIKTCSHNEGK